MKEEETALHLYAKMFKEILDLPEVQKSREVLEGQSIVKIVAHALERQYLRGAIESEELGDLDEDYWGSDNDLDRK